MFVISKTVVFRSTMAVRIYCPETSPWEALWLWTARSWWQKNAYVSFSQKWWIFFALLSLRQERVEVLSRTTDTNSEEDDDNNKNQSLEENIHRNAERMYAHDDEMATIDDHMMDHSWVRMTPCPPKSWEMSPEARGWTVLLNWVYCVWPEHDRKFVLNWLLVFL